MKKLEKRLAIKGLNVGSVQHCGFMIREGEYFLNLCLQDGCVDNVLVILKKKRNICIGKGKKPGKICETEDCHIVRLTI